MMIPRWRKDAREFAANRIAVTALQDFFCIGARNEKTALQM
jgi:hypothetical protein